MNPLVTVGLVFHNAGDTLERAVTSVFCQTFDDWELILVDDGSVDRSNDIAESICDPRVRLVRHGDNRGLSVRLNEIADLARGRYVARMDADDVMHPDRLQRQVDCLRANPTCDVVDSAVYVIDETDIVVGRRGGHSVPAVPTEVITNKFIIHPTVMAKAEWFRENRYDEQYVRAEDHELWSRTWHKTRFNYLDTPLLFYRNHSRVEVAKYNRSAQTDRKVYRTYGPAMVGLAATTSLVWKSLLKQWCYLVAAVVGLDVWLVRRRDARLAPAEQKTAAEVLRSVNSATAAGRSRKSKCELAIKREPSGRLKSVPPSLQTAGRTVDGARKPDCRLTVGLAYHNASATLRLALKSIFCQSFQDWELILVDDGSTDTSAEIVSAISDSRVRVVRHHERRGLAARLNEIADLAGGTFLARMDADDVMHPDRLRQQLEFLQTHEDCDVVDSAVYVIDERQTVIGRRGGHSVPPVPAEVITNKFIIHPTVMGKTAWFRTHKYDDRRLLAQDHELWCRTWRATRSSHLSQPLLFYFQPSRVNARKYSGSARSDRAIYRAYGPTMVGVTRTATLLLSSALKQACYTAAAFVALDSWLLRTRNTPLAEAESQIATDLLRAVDSVTLPRRCAASGPATSC